MNIKYRPTIITLICALLIFLINLPFLIGAVEPINDTAQIYKGFYFFYSHLYYGDLFDWFEMLFSKSSNAYYQLIFLTPSCYAVMLLGKLFSASNIAVLFIVSNIIDQLVLLTGVYLIAQGLFKHKSVVFFVCSGSILSTVWYSQLWWNLRFYYLLPTVIYCFLVFFEKRKPEALWLAGMMFAMSLLGNIPSFAIVPAFIALIILTVMTFDQPDAWKNVFSRTLSNFTAFLLFAVVSTGCLVLVIKAIISGVEIGLPSYPNIDAINLFQMFFLGWPIHTCWNLKLGNTVYIGLPPLLFGLYALTSIRDKFFLMFLFFVFSLVCFASAGMLAKTLCRLTEISICKHPDLILGLIKILILFCAGLGLERAITHISFKHILVSFMLIFLMADHVGGGFWFTADTGWSIILIIRLGLYLIFFLITLVSYLLLRPAGLKNNEAGFLPLEHPFLIRLLISCYLVDLFLFQYLVYLDRR